MPPLTITLWPSEKTDKAAAGEKVLPDRADKVRRITDITMPSLTVYRAGAQDKAPAVLIFPGGGYSILAIDKEGAEIAAWLNSINITAIVVKYTVPGNRAGAFQDVQRALRLAHQHAMEWNIDPKRIGVMGFSAGGHLAARLSTDFKNQSYTKLDEADKQNYRPDFCVLLYPAYLGNKTTRELAPELPVTADMPPTFIVQTKDDKGFIDGTIAYAEALKKVSVSTTLHIFKNGGHGYGLRPSEHEVSKWPALCEKWFKANLIISDLPNQPVAGAAK